MPSPVLAAALARGGEALTVCPHLADALIAARLTAARPADQRPAAAAD